MANTNTNTAAPTGGDNSISNILGNIGQTATQTDNPSGSGSGAAPTATNSKSGSASSDASNTASLTNAPSLGTASASISSLSGAPSLTSGDIPHLTGLPTLSGYYSYPAATPPPISNAPYMQKQNLPENFVFILVGAIIAFVALIIVVWRVLISWSMNRRFRRDGVGAGKGNYTPLADFKQKPAATSTHDMKDLGNLPKNFSSVPSLFFSPTAEVARHSMGPGSAKGGTQHMPAGHYRDSSRN